MKTEQALLKEINQYFYAIYKNREVSETETRNALDSYLNYFMGIFGLDTADYEIIIHADKSISKQSKFLAMVCPDKKYYNKYDVYLNKYHMKMKEPEDLTLLINMFISASHEFKHIIQFELMPYQSDASCKNYTEVCDKCEEFKNSKDKVTKRLLERLRYILETNSSTEKDADISAFLIFERILRTFQSETDDENYAEFLELCCEIINDTKKFRKKLFKLQDDDYKKVRLAFKKLYNIETSLV